MSYDIIYARQFIKAEKEEKTFLLPFVLTGSNNCYEDNRRRARSWWNWNYYIGNKPMGTIEEIEDSIDRVLAHRIANSGEDTEEEIKNRWSYYDGLVNHVQKGNRFIDFKRFFTNGAKQSITVEQLVQGGEHLYITTGYIYHKEEENKMQGKELFNKVIKTTQELFDTIEEATEYHKDLDVGFTIKISFMNDKSAYTRLRKRIFGNTLRKRKEPIETNDVYGIKIKGYGYFARRLRGSGFKYAYSLNGGKLYPTEQAAKKRIKQIEKYIGHELTVEHEHYNYTVRL